MTALSLGLLGGTAAAFAVAESLKLERLPIVGPRFTAQFSPVCQCRTSVAVLSLRSRFSDRVDAVIVDQAGEDVRTLAEDEEIRPGRFAFRWDGKDDGGAVVPDGQYRLRLHLDGKERTILVPNLVQVDTRPPTAKLLRVEPHAISPDGDSRAERVRLVYRASNLAGPVLLVDGSVVEVWPPRQRRSRVFWDGLQDGRVARPGRHELALQVRDRAGNLSEPTRSVVVRIRYVELDRNVYRVRRGGDLHFRVGADGEVGWALRRQRNGRLGAVLLSGSVSGNAVSASLPGRVLPGRYALVVTVGSRHDRALVRVERAAIRGGRR